MPHRVLTTRAEHLRLVPKPTGLLAQPVHASAGALKPAAEDQDSATSLLIWGIVLIAHIVALSTFNAMQSTDQTFSQAAQTISVALIQTPSPAPTQVAPAANKPEPVSVQKPTPTKHAVPATPVLDKPAATVAPSPSPVVTAHETTEAPAKAPITLATANPSNNPAPEKADAEPLLVAPKFNADYLHNPAPDYPNLARRRGEQGRVILKVLVNSDGLPERIQLDQSSGYELLDKSALQAVKSWKFIPATSNNRPVSGSVLVPIRFSLDS